MHLTQGKFDFNKSGVESVSLALLNQVLQTHPISAFVATPQFEANIDVIWIWHLKPNLIWHPKIKHALVIVLDTQARLDKLIHIDCVTLKLMCVKLKHQPIMLSEWGEDFFIWLRALRESIPSRENARCFQHHLEQGPCCTDL